MKDIGFWLGFRRLWPHPLHHGQAIAEDELDTIIRERPFSSAGGEENYFSFFFLSGFRYFRSMSVFDLPKAGLRMVPSLVRGSRRGRKTLRR